VTEEVWATQPALVLLRDTDPPALRGEFLLREDEALLERYTIEVQLPLESERALPAVREIGGRIPRTADRHVSDDGTLCVVQPAAYWFAQPKGQTLAEFLEGPVRSHLAMQAIVEHGGTWPTGEWGHGALGIVECFSEILNTTDPAAVKALIAIVAEGSLAVPVSEWAEVSQVPRPSGPYGSAKHPVDCA